jgi:uncharacterized protein (TIGR02996 family)
MSAGAFLHLTAKLGTMVTDEPLNPELERAIMLDLDNQASWRVYADWLTAHGNQRGELIALQLALEHEDTPERRARESALIASLRTPALERIESHLVERAYTNGDEPRVTNPRGGFWRQVVFAGPPAVLLELLAHPSARLLRTLTLGSEDFQSAIEALASSPPLEALRELRIGVLPEGNDLADFDQRSCGDLSALTRACPRLEVLRLICPHFVVGAHPTLRVLDARVGAAPDSVAGLARASLAKLEELHLGYEYERNDDSSPICCEAIEWGEDALEPLLDGDVLPALERLFLWPSPEPSSWQLERVKASALGRRLEKLEVRSMDALEEDTDAYTT